MITNAKYIFYRFPRLVPFSLADGSGVRLSVRSIYWNVVHRKTRLFGNVDQIGATITSDLFGLHSTNGNTTAPPPHNNTTSVSAATSGLSVSASF